MTQLSRVDRLKSALTGARRELKESARVGTNAMITSLGGGVIGGWCNAKHPTIFNTNVSTAGAVGSALVLAALTGIFEEYSDQAAALGSGLLASAIADESEKYFSS
jgi:uncharacterized membrane protein YeiH